MCNKESISLIKNLTTYIGEDAAVYIEKFTRGLTLKIRVTKERESKFGDYLQSVNGKPQRITVNGNLDKFSFLITFLHELAHLKAFEIYGKKIKAHGKEWKSEFVKIIIDSLNNELFPAEIANIIKEQYVNKKKLSYSSRIKISDSINKYLNIKIPKRLEDFPINASVELINGMKVKIIEQKRTRFLCRCLNDNKMYFVQKKIEVVKQHS